MQKQGVKKTHGMQHGGGLFDGSRMFWGGFDTIVDTSKQRSTQQAGTPITA